MRRRSSSAPPPINTSSCRDASLSREAIRNLNLDVLLYTDLGMEGFTWSLAFSRLVRVQAAMWGHPITSGLETIDYFISSDLAEAEGAEANYTEKLDPPEESAALLFPSAARYRARARSFQLPADAHVYGCLQATFKLHPEFDVVLAEILKRDEKGSSSSRGR